MTNQRLLQPEYDLEIQELGPFKTASITEVGEHTPGANSDSYYLNNSLSTELEPGEMRIVALVADGITGDLSSKCYLTGQFASLYFAENFPQLFSESNVVDPYHRLVDSLNQVTLAMGRAFQQQFFNHEQKLLSAGTTICGIAESNDDIILFSAGDSFWGFIDQDGYNPSFSSELHLHQPSGRLTSAICVETKKDNSLYILPPINLSYRTMPKECFRPGIFLLCTDGLIPDKDHHRLLAECALDYPTGIKAVVETALNHALSREMGYPPDDKTVVAVEITGNKPLSSDIIISAEELEMFNAVDRTLDKH